MKLLNHLWVYKAAVIAASALAMTACTTTQQITDGNGNVNRTVQTVAGGAAVGAIIGAAVTYVADPATGTMVLAQNALLGAAIGGAVAYGLDFLNNPAQGNMQTTNVNVVAPAPAGVLDDSAYLQGGATRLPNGGLRYRNPNGVVWVTPAINSCTIRDEARGYIWSVEDLRQCPNPG